MMLIALVAFLLIAFGNALTIATAIRTKQSRSLVPVVGGVLGVVAVLLSPLPHWCVVVPVLLDVGTGAMLFAALWHLRTWRSTTR
jgi:hypothetical protein